MLVILMSEEKKVSDCCSETIEVEKIESDCDCSEHEEKKKEVEDCC